MNFAPKTEKQLTEERLIPAGIYPFEVVNAEAKKSKKGNDMIEIQLRVFMPDGTERAIKDWLMELIAFKLFHFCSYTGLAAAYANGTLTSHDVLNKTGFVKVGIQTDKKKQYEDQNNVVDYMRDAGTGMKRSGVTAPADAPAAPAPVTAPEDDVPY